MLGVGLGVWGLGFSVEGLGLRVNGVREMFRRSSRYRDSASWISAAASSHPTWKELPKSVAYSLQAP